MIKIMQQINNLRMFCNFEEMIICLNSNLYKDITNPIPFPYHMIQSDDGKFTLEYYILDGVGIRFVIDEYYKQPKVFIIPTRQ